MRKVVFSLYMLGIGVFSLTSCESSNITDDVYETTETQATGQGEVGDPVDDDDEEGRS